MSPDRTTLTRAEAIRLRKEEEEKRRDKRTPKNLARLKPVGAPKAAALPKAKHPAQRSAVQATPSRLRHRYDIAMSSPYGRSTTFSAPKASREPITLPRMRFGPRWFSFLIAIFCVVDMYLMVSIDPFIVRHATVNGLQRLNTQEIENALGANNQPAALLNPAQIEYNLLAAFPEIAAAEVQINLPATLVVSIKERVPVAAWIQDGQTVWVDAQGFAFPPRGDAQNLMTITANGAPPPHADLNPAQTIGARPFLSADLASSITVLTANLPEGANLVFDPQYGLGWNDPNGWKVYFGHTNGDTTLKLQVYQAILTNLSEQDIQPTLISVEYPAAPFYRIEPLEQ